MKLNKFFAIGGALLGFSLTACVGDLDLEPNDPNYGNATDYEAVLAKCYSGIVWLCRARMVPVVPISQDLITVADSTPARCS